MHVNVNQLTTPPIYTNLPAVPARRFSERSFLAAHPPPPRHRPPPRLRRLRRRHLQVAGIYVHVYIYIYVLVV